MSDMTHIGRYDVKQVLGQGGMARVYLAHDPHFNRDVAVKVLSQKSMDNTAVRGKFEAEARLIAGLEHNAIVPVYDFGTHQDQPYLVMRLMTGGTLEDRLRRGPLPVARIELILRRICSALDKAHANHIVHRDLKPANILFDDGDMPYLADFGIARLTDVTQTTTIIGTPSYMAPEQALGEPLDARTDVYQMGVVLFEMLTGHVPYQGEHSTAVLYQHVHEPIPNLRQFSAAVPDYYQQVVTSAMAKQPAQRPATAGELYERFKNAPTMTRAYEPTTIVPLPPVTPTEIVPDPPQEKSAEAGGRNKVWLAAGGTAVVILLLGLIAVWWFTRPPTATPTSDAPAITNAVELVTATASPAKSQPSTATVEPLIVVVENENDTAVSPEPTATMATTTATATATSAPLASSDALGGGSGQLVFAADFDGNYDLFSAPLDDPRRLTQLTNHIANDFGGRFSPDGTQIAFHTYRDNNWEVYTMSRDGTGKRNISNHGRDDSFAAWSPDGQQLLFHSNRDGDFEIYVVNADGSNLRQLTFNGRDDLGPVWSPDGTQIAFHQRVGDYHQIFIMNADGTVAQQITNDPVDHRFAQWSPTGSQLVFQVESATSTEIVVANLDGTGRQTISPAGYESFYPTWSPDGQWVAFHGRVPDSENREIFLVNVYTGAQQTMTNSANEERMPAWQPVIQP